MDVLRTDVVKQDSLKKDIAAYVQPDLLDNSATKVRKNVSFYQINLLNFLSSFHFST